MAKLSRAQQLSALKSDNENLKCLNSRLIKDLADLKQEIASLLESEKSLEGELSRSHGQRAAHLAELEATRLASRINSEILDAMKLEKEELQRSVAEARKSSFWTLAFSGRPFLALLDLWLIYGRVEILKILITEFHSKPPLVAGSVWAHHTIYRNVLLIFLCSLFALSLFSAVKSLPLPPFKSTPFSKNSTANLGCVQQFAILKSDNKNSKCLNARLPKDLEEKKREITIVLNSQKYLKMAAHLAGLEAIQLAIRSNLTETEEMKLELEGLYDAAAEAYKKSF
ncbi:hypothetical protein Nepgr_001203 [Nepenthes gracilis]|uniref:Uncharacterized protein n=1 Tax=Nepenthes gracilis TaxID=150966 RepID=A0AAD3P7U5_NEPGR|nr:hypothetical protein Nepgr_001203 [Nepenthes gracilis]